MAKLLDWTWEAVAPEEGEPPTNLHRLRLPDDELELTEIDVLRFYMNTASYLRSTYPASALIPLDVKASIGMSIHTMWQWLGITLPANLDPRLHDQDVQSLMLAKALGKYRHGKLTPDQVIEGAIILLRARAAVVPQLTEAVEVGIAEINARTAIPARNYQVAGAVEQDDEEPDTADHKLFREMLALDLDVVIKGAEAALTQTMAQLTGIDMEPSAFDPNEGTEIAAWVMDALKEQRQAKPETPCFLTKAMADRLTRDAHRISHRTLSGLVADYRLLMLVVAGPNAGSLALVDVHGQGKPLALYPLREA